MILKKIFAGQNTRSLKLLTLLISCLLRPDFVFSEPHQSLKYLNENKSGLMEIYAIGGDTNTENKLKYAHKKSVAIVLAVLLGPFGVHRLYLGTHAKVPVIYTLTLGGGFGILPLLDIIAILNNKNWEEDFIPNNKVIMWSK